MRVASAISFSFPQVFPWLRQSSVILQGARFTDHGDVTQRDLGAVDNAGGLRLNPIILLPMQRDFVSYQGSLTTPPCTEGVRWLVMRTPLRVSRAQADRITRIISENARPVQALNGRRVISGR